MPAGYIDHEHPGMEGLSVLKKIRALEAQTGIFGTKGVKIVMITASNEKSDIFKAFKEQCDAYLVKPIDKSKLLEAIEKLGLID